MSALVHRLIECVPNFSEGRDRGIADAIADAIAGASILPLLRADDRVVALRSFGKFYGLAGVRLGFVAGASRAVERVAALLGGWPVSATALAYGTAAYRDMEWAARMRTRLAADAAALDALLATHGLAARGGCPLFRLVESPEAGGLFAALATAGILTRPFDDHPDRLRFGLPARGYDRLADALLSFAHRREAERVGPSNEARLPEGLDTRLRGDDAAACGVG